MVTYADMTFCPFFETCEKGKKCPRALTEEVKDATVRVRMHLSIFMEKPKCFEEKK